MAIDNETDWFVPQYRELAGQLWHGYPLKLAFLWHVGHPIAFRMPDDLNMLPFQAAIAGQLPQAVGLAWGLKLKGDPGVVLAIFGDGGTSQGDFHEAMNLAGVTKAPVIFLCQNNGWAISTHVAQQTASDRRRPPSERRWRSTTRRTGSCRSIASLPASCGTATR